MVHIKYSTVQVYFVDRGRDVDSLVTCGPSDGVNEAPPIVIPYSGKFSHGAKFRVFLWIGWLPRK